MSFFMLKRVYKYQLIRKKSTQNALSPTYSFKMLNTKIRLIIFFAANDGDLLYSQQKQDQGLTVAQIMNSLLPNSELN